MNSGSQMMSRYLCLFSPLGWPSHTTFSIHRSIKVTFLKCSNPSQKPYHSRNVGKSSHCLSHISLLKTITTGRGKQCSDWLHQGHVRSEPHKPPALREEEGLVCEGKIRLLFPKKSKRQKQQMFLIATSCSGSVWGKPENFGKFYILKNCLSKSHKVDLIHRWTV